MKYIVIYEKRGDIFPVEFNTAGEAVEYAEDYFEHMSDFDRAHADELYVLESHNPDDDAEDHFDGVVLMQLI